MVENTIPAILYNNAQPHTVVGMCWTNNKVATKSLEQGTLWHIHPRTHKAVEYVPILKVVAVHKKKNWCEIELDTLHDSASQISPIFLPVPVHKAPITHTQDLKNSGRKTGYEFLETLQHIIEERKTQPSEGSYTSHLFESGKEKIRKKLGEEAIETILSTDTHTLISESADLLYHLFVMLIHENINPSLMIDELYTRFLK